MFPCTFIRSPTCHQFLCFLIEAEALNPPNPGQIPTLKSGILVAGKQTLSPSNITFQRVEAFLLGSLIDAAEIISKVWIRIGCQQDLHHTVGNETERRSRAGVGRQGSAIPPQAFPASEVEPGTTTERFNTTTPAQPESHQMWDTRGAGTGGLTALTKTHPERALGGNHIPSPPWESVLIP